MITSLGKAYAFTVCLAAQVGKSRVLYRLDTSTLERTKIADIPTPSLLSPSWIHDFPFTENFIIIPDTPVKFNLPVSGAFYAFICM